MDIATLGLRIDDSGAMRTVDGLGSRLDALAAKGEGAVSRLKSSFLGFAAATGLSLIGAKLLKETIDAQNAMAQLEAAVKSTGGAAGLTVKQLDDLSAAMQRTTTFSDEAVKGAESLLLTFTKIRGDQFVQATQAVADLATRMGGDLKGAALQVGKALNDPTQGLTALTRSGVSFTEAQKKLIVTLFETGQQAKAQQMILAELRNEFGGSAEAARNTLGGALEYLKNQWGDLFEVSKESSSGIVDSINGIGAALPAIRDGFNAFFRGYTRMIVDMSYEWQHFIAFFKNDTTLLKGLDQWKKEQYAILDAAQKAPVGGAIPNGAFGSGRNTNDPVTLSDSYKEASAKQLAELEKLKALNAAYQETDLALQIIGIQYDAVAQKTENATKVHGDELKRLNAITDAIATQKIAAAQLAEQKKTDDATRAFGIASDASLAAMQQATTEQRQLTAARLQGQAAIDVLTVKLAGQHAVQEKLNEATQQGAIVTFAYLRQIRAAAEASARAAIDDDKVAKGIAAADEAAKKAAADAADAAEKAADEARDRWKTMLDEMQRGTSTFFQDVLNNGVSSFRTLFGSIKQLFFRMLADMAAVRLAPKLAGALGGLFPMLAVAQGSQTSTGGGVSAGLGGLGTQITKDAAKFGGTALVGFGAGYGLGSATGSKATGALGGATAGALYGAQFGPWGAAIGGLTGLVGGLLGAGSAAKKAAREMKDLQAALAINFAAYKAQITGDSLAVAVAQSQANLKDILKQIDAAYSGKKNETVRNQKRAEAEALQVQDETRIRAQFTADTKAQREDYEVRRLRALGKTKEADTLAFAEQQQREYAAAVKANADATTLAALAQAQAAEKAQFAAKAIGDMTESLSNAPSGFKIALERFRATMGVSPTASSSAPAYTPPAPLVYHITGPVNITSSATNSEDLLADVAAQLQREATRGGTTRLNVALGAQGTA